MSVKKETKARLNLNQRKKLEAFKENHAVKQIIRIIPGIPSLPSCASVIMSLPDSLFGKESTASMSVVTTP